MNYGWLVVKHNLKFDWTPKCIVDIRNPVPRVYCVLLQCVVVLYYCACTVLIYIFAV